MRRFVVCSIAGALTASAALGQSLTGPVTQGAVPPGQSFSLQDDGSSLAGNPAGLGFVRGFEADFLHNGYYGSGYGDANALDFAFGAGPLALALGFDWLNQSDPSGSRSSYRRTSIGGALRLGELSLGAAHRGFSGVDLSQAWDFGALARPNRWLSLGAAALDANRPAMLPRQWVLSAALRPWRERLDLAADLRWSECTNAPAGSVCGIDHRNWILTAQARVWQGVTLIGQLAVLDGSQTTGLVGLQLDLGHLGATYGTGMGGLPTWDTWRLRASSERWPGVRMPETAVEIDLRKALSPPRPGPLTLVFGTTFRDPLSETILTLRRLSRDSGTKVVVLRSGGLPLGLGRAEELRAAIENLKGSGKKVLFYLESGGDLEYSVALAADRIYAAPQAVLLVNGFAATALFAAAGLDKLGVKAEFVRVGAYKTAPDLFTRRDMSSEQREVVNALLDDVFGRYVRRVTQARHLDEEKFRRLLDRGLQTPQEAQAQGLVDGLVYPDQLEEEVGKLVGGHVALEKVGTEPPIVRSPRWAPPPTVAVVRVEGDIARGEGGSDPFGLFQVAGSEAIARRIHRLADDPSVKAIVVRIDSPGGDGSASDLIWRELVRARKEKGKPVVASMGDVAASGGYYVAVAADEIYAEPSTVTGSIGVFVGKFDLEELYRELGLRLTTIKRGKSADLFSTARALTDEERRTLQEWVDAFYAQFVDRVAEGRRLPRERVDELGRGRVWSGSQALERGLLDKMGGLRDAIASAKARAGIGPDEAVLLDDAGKREVSFLPELQVLPGSLRPLSARALRALALLGEPGTLRAVLPFDLEVN